MRFKFDCTKTLPNTPSATLLSVHLRSRAASADVLVGGTNLHYSSTTCTICDEAALIVAVAGSGSIESPFRSFGCVFRERLI